MNLIAHRWTRRSAPLLVGGLIAAGTVALGSGTYALFSDTKEATLAVGAGSVTLAPINGDGPNNRLSVAATGITPGQSIQRVVRLRNVGSMAMSGATLTTSAEPGSSSLLDTDGVNGLQMVIEKCSAPWTESGTAPNYTYECTDPATTSSTLGSGRVTGANRGLDNLTLTPQVDNHLRVTLTLPAHTGNEFQGLTTRILFSFTGTQATE